ncbi:hypothetical protein [Pedobacter caeni]|uniref:Uncharacterized protein n=1 Tax=Pedobacter caeni TaxID=288992 RepID=A0A1M5G7X9_9SPHI|nr:hypothetical protein [Pedobacter caeni]SHF99855.1 hypothetical protein SAMN04488522_104100 [Pedobacter caeni]
MNLNPAQVSFISFEPKTKNYETIMILQIAQRLMIKIMIAS